MIDEANIDTYGFPYVYGMTPSTYSTTKLPDDLEDGMRMLLDLRQMVRDIKYQLDERETKCELLKVEGALAADDEEDYLSWRISAVSKMRHTSSQIRLLQAWVKKNRDPDSVGFTIEQSKQIHGWITKQNKTHTNRLAAIEARLLSQDNQIKHLKSMLKNVGDSDQGCGNKGLLNRLKNLELRLSKQSKVTDNIVEEFRIQRAFVLRVFVQIFFKKDEDVRIKKELKNAVNWIKKNPLWGTSLGFLNKLEIDKGSYSDIVADDEDDTLDEIKAA
ncbi:hypothetical protein kac65v151_gp094 [Nodularia phage vB_NspS-kac65v151]|jgi:uncharacterized coiled-coil protein SlyX|uniref:Uncharacterized protein n=2 Tax=Ravarandavirus kac65v151 TaxID=2845689 RepID=A0A482MJ39_9CAUD|nr:hypothetical protein HWC12_gp094 [Nodularia phage vB_NspS-kac65v151]QBQ73124.1 hypothetical protein kac65v151_gp094 [Nodularia phage vB_NspS-kac65v151]QBQ73332.1 hypothetical protein kac65v161_gp094 [Nodularia phage vB_NspS-kac65v161]